LVQWEVDDSFILKTINIDKTDTFKGLIEGICHHVYSDIKLDSLFEIKNWMENLLESEAFLAITKKRHRDHLLHACRIAILGEKLLREDFPYKGSNLKLLDIVRNLMLKDESTKDRFHLYNPHWDRDSDEDSIKESINEIIIQVWYISALFHDMGYVYESFLQGWTNINFLMNFPNFRDLYFDIESAMTKFKNEFTVSNTFPENSTYLFSRKCDHGKIGACLISNLVGESNLICDLASKITDDHTSNEIVEFEKNPLSFLLILLDEVQDWGRPTISKKMREQILSEELKNGSPFLQNGPVTPELEKVIVQLDFVEINESLNINIKFILNFGEEDTIITNDKYFNYPWYLYSKYKNLQRLQIGNVNKVSGDLPGSTSDLELNTFIEFRADSPLLDGLHRQCNILYFKTLLENNHALCDWTKNYRETPQVKFEISNDRNLPKILNGDYDRVLESAHGSYLIDRNIKEEYEAVYTYEKGPNNDSLFWITEITRVIASCQKGVPIKGVYASFDQTFIDYDTIEVIVNNTNITSEVKSKRVEGTDNPVYNVKLAMFVPFDKPLYYPEKYTIKYKIKFIIPIDLIEVSSRADTIMNLRSRDYDKPKLAVNWDKELFNRFSFKLGIMFKSSENMTPREIFQIISDCERDKPEDIEKFIKDRCGKEHYIGLHRKNEVESEANYSFKFPDIDLEPLANLGFIWTSLE
jgi:hypothetical protein